jgi:HNH endonuclease
MDATSDEVVRAQLLLGALFLSDEASEGVLGHAPLEWVSEWLGLAPAAHFGREALQHLLAIQLAPRSAIMYRNANPTPRWRLIDRYLSERYALGEAERERLARTVSSVLDRAAMGRGPALLAPESVSECGICRLPFKSEPPSVLSCDPYKPTWEAPEELCRPEVDHVVAISGLGSHEVSNLQVVCRACNLAKGAGLIIDPGDEIRYAAYPVGDVSRMHRFRLLQWLIRRHDGRCASCGRTVGELTMRPVHDAAPLARTTLSLRCYDCCLVSG